MAFRFIQAEKANHSIRLMCRVLRVSRSAFYEWLRRAGKPRRDVGLSARIRAIHKASRGTYGAPRVTAALRQDGLLVNRKRVARIMRELGLRGVPRKRPYRGPTAPTSPREDLLQREFTAARPNKAWVADITYLPVAGGWVYLAVLIDLYSRKVVGWALDSNMRTELCMEALRRALAARRPPEGLVHHSDRGSQYSSDAYQRALLKAGLRPSVGRKGECWDNAVAESFFGTLKQELVRGEPFSSLKAARRSVSDYVHNFYNPVRLHSAIGQAPPSLFESHNQSSGQPQTI